MKRLSPSAIENLAFTTGRAIEVDEAGGVMVLVVAGQTYYADLPERAVTS